MATGANCIEASPSELDLCGCCLQKGDFELLSCSLCSVRVHPACYGAVDYKDHWICSPCSSLSDSLRSSAICCLCKIPGGALKPTNIDSWSHLCCALWIPETWIAGGNVMQPIVGIDKVHPSRMKLKCTFCKQTSGCVQCTSGRCAISFHVICGVRNGVRFELLQKGKTVVTTALCLKHKALEEKTLIHSDQHEVDDKIDDCICDVCMSGESADNNVIVICDGCNLAVHQHCYGIMSVPKDAWFCQCCQANVTAKCVLCSTSGGAAKRLGETEWVHIICIFFSGQAYFDQPRKLESVQRVSELPINEPGRSCEICKSSVGFCAPCACSSCDKFLHVYCARKANRRTQIFSFKHQREHLSFLPRFKLRESQFDFAFLVFCETHDGAEYNFDSDLHSPIKEIDGPTAVEKPELESDNESDDFVILSKKKGALLPDRSKSPIDVADQVTVSNPTTDNERPDVLVFWEDTVGPYFFPIQSDQIALLQSEAIADDPSFIIPPSQHSFSRRNSFPFAMPIAFELSSICGRIGIEAQQTIASANSVLCLVSSSSGQCLCEFRLFLNDRRVRSWEDVSSGASDAIPRLTASLNSMTGFLDSENNSFASEELASLQMELVHQIQDNNVFRRSIFNAITVQEMSSTAIVRNQHDNELLQSYLQISHSQIVRLSLAKGFCDVNSPLDEFSHDHFNTTCRACFGMEGTEVNPIVICELCGLAVHKYCYGIVEVPDGDWHCDTCSNRIDVVDIQHECLLCPLTGFAFKRSNCCDMPVHLVCAAWTDGIGIDAMIGVSPIANVAEALASKPSGHVCFICSDPYGITITCSFASCDQYMHVTCAWEFGLFMTVQSIEGHAVVSSFCENHTPITAGGPERNRLTQREIRLKSRTQKPLPSDSSVIESAPQKPQRPGRSPYSEPVPSSLPLPPQVALTTPRNLNGEDVYLADVCGICFGLSGAADALTTCVYCGIAVHLSCFRFSSISHQTPWYCSKCAANLQQSKPLKCQLCPRFGGAYQRVSLDRWCHVACIQWSLDPSTRRSLLEGVDVISPIANHQMCGLCSCSAGVCIQCSRMGCPELFHPLCALFSGCSLREEADGIFALCKVHTPLPSASKDDSNPSGSEIAFFEKLSLVRNDMDELRTVLDLVRRREKVKRNIYTIQFDAIATELQLSEEALKRKQAELEAAELEKMELEAAQRKQSELQAEECQRVALGAVEIEERYVNSLAVEAEKNANAKFSDSLDQKSVSTRGRPRSKVTNVRIPRSDIIMPRDALTLRPPNVSRKSSSRLELSFSIPRKSRFQKAQSVPVDSRSRRHTLDVQKRPASDVSDTSPVLSQRRRDSLAPSVKGKASATTNGGFSEWRATRSRGETGLISSPETVLPMKRTLHPDSSQQSGLSPIFRKRRRSLGSAHLSPNSQPMSKSKTLLPRVGKNQSEDRCERFIQCISQCRLNRQQKGRALEFIRKHRNQSRTAERFQVNDIVLAYQKGPKLYDCKILDVCADGSYRLHYISWAKRYDEVVPPSSVFKDTPEVRALQAALDDLE